MRRVCVLYCLVSEGQPGWFMEGTALEFLPWEAKGFDGLELPKAHTYTIVSGFPT